MFNPLESVYFYILIGILVALGLVSWYKSKNLPPLPAALVKLKYSLIAFGVLTFALMFTLPSFFSSPHINTENITTLEKAVSAIQKQNEYLEKLSGDLNTFRFALYAFMQFAVVILCVSVYNFAKALVPKNGESDEKQAPVNILHLNDE